VLLPVAVAVAVVVIRSGLAELAVVSVAVVRRPTDDGGRVVGQRGMAAAAGTRRRAGDRDHSPCRQLRCRGVRRGRMAPLWYQVRLSGPGLLRRHRALPGRGRRNRRLPRSRDNGVQPETERDRQPQRERHGPAQPTPRRTSGRHHRPPRRRRVGLLASRRRLRQLERCERRLPESMTVSVTRRPLRRFLSDPGSLDGPHGRERSRDRS
jgi:hypothetical protein